MNTMIHICVVCTGQGSSLMSLSDEHRRILALIVSPTLNLSQLQKFPLWICESCKGLTNTVVSFKNIAHVGVLHLLNRLSLVQKENDQHLQKENPPLLPVKQEPDDLLQVKSFVEVQTEEACGLPRQVQDMKTECLDYDEPPETTGPRGSPRQATRPATVHTAMLNPLLSKPDVRQPTLVLHPLTVPGRSDPADRQTDSSITRLSTLDQTPMVIPLSPGSGTLVKSESNDEQRATIRKQELPTQGKRNAKAKRLQLFPLVPIGASTVHNSKSKEKQKEINAEPVKKKNERMKYPTLYDCLDCGYMTRNRGAIYRHKCYMVDQEREANSKKPTKRPREPPGSVPRSEWNARFVCEAKLPSEQQRTRSKIRPHSCPLCPATFKIRAALYAHRRLKHRKDRDCGATTEPTAEKDELAVALEALESSMQFQF